MLESTLKKRLAGGEVAISMQVRLVESIEIAHMAAAAGYDTFYIDLEHASMSLRTVSQICIAGISAGVTPMIRTGDLASHTIARMLDVGALGIIAPHVRSADDAASLVDACRFSPRGSRGVSVGCPHFLHRALPARQAQQELDAATTVAVMIESRDALESVESIASVEGLDLMLVGTNDLCAELGIAGDFDHPLVEEAYDRIIAAGKASGTHVGVGGLAGRPELMRKYLDKGASFVSSGSDLQFLAKAMTDRCVSLRQTFGSA